MGKSGNFILNVRHDRAMPHLKRALYTSQMLRKVEMFFVRSGTNQSFYKITLEDVRITQITESVDSDISSGLLNQVKLDATRIGWTYWPSPLNSGS